ncbi:MAG: hypothetical protein ACK5V3_12240 [Bdellovibrionales bacterium]
MADIIIDSPAELSSQDREVLARHVGQNGFSSMTLLKASILTGHSISFYYCNWETDKALRVWIAAQIQDEFLMYFEPIFSSKKNPSKGDLADILDKYLNLVSKKESFHRLCAWSTVENDPDIKRICRETQVEFFTMICQMFRDSQSMPEDKIEIHAYLFANFWKIYAGLVWNDSQVCNSSIKVEKLKEQLKAFIIESVFEN